MARPVVPVDEATAAVLYAAMEAVAAAESVAERARAREAQAIQAALDGGFSVRAVAEAVARSKDYVQRRARP